MNIFILDPDPVIAAQMQCDKHVVKMPLECAQMLSAVHHIHGSDNVDEMYKVTHRNHPCTVWAAQSRANYMWLFEHFRALSNEYRFRYGNTHLSWFKLRDVLSTPPAALIDDDLTPFAQAMPDEYKHDDAVTAYRAYYLNDKAHMLAYTHRDMPSWIMC
jgi:hypothetical protein